MSKIEITASDREPVVWFEDPTDPVDPYVIGVSPVEALRLAGQLMKAARAAAMIPHQYMRDQLALSTQRPGQIMCDVCGRPQGASAHKPLLKAVK